MPPAQFGIYSLILVWGGLVSSLGPAALRNVGFGLFFHWRENGSQRALLAAITGLQIIAFVLPFGILVAIDPTSQMTLSLVVSGGVAFALSDFYILQLLVLRAEDRARLYATCEVASNVVRVAVTIVLLESGFVSVPALFGAWIAGSAVGIGFALPFVNRVLRRGVALRTRFGAIHRELILPAARSVPWSIGIWINDVADRAILMRFEGLAVVGIYSANYALSSRLVSALSQPLYVWVWPRILKASVEQGERAVEREIALGFKFYLWLAALPTAILCLRPAWVTGILLGPEYRNADVVVSLVAVGAFFQGAAAYFNRGIEIAGRYGLMSLVTLAASAVNIVGNLVLIPIIGLSGAALATTATYIALFLFYAVLERPKFHLSHSGEYLLPVAVAVAAVYLARIASVGGVWLAAVMLVGVYAAAAAVTLRTMIRSRD